MSSRLLFSIQIHYLIIHLIILQKVVEVEDKGPRNMFYYLRYLILGNILMLHFALIHYNMLLFQSPYKSYHMQEYTYQIKVLIPSHSPYILPYLSLCNLLHSTTHSLSLRSLNLYSGLQDHSVYQYIVYKWYLVLMSYSILFHNLYTIYLSHHYSCMHNLIYS